MAVNPYGFDCHYLLYTCSLASYQQITGKLNRDYLSAEYQYVILLLISNCVLSANYQQIKPKQE